MFSESLVGLFSESLTVFSERQRKVTNVIRTDQIFCVFFSKIICRRSISLKWKFFLRILLPIQKIVVPLHPEFEKQRWRLSVSLY